MALIGFDDREVTWQLVPFIGAQVYVLACDAQREIADVMIRFDADVPGKLHRHLCEFSTFVLQGELRFWQLDGTPKEVRPVASYVRIAKGGEPHSEGAGAGAQTAIVLFSFWGTTGDMIHYLDPDGTTAFRLGFSDFERIWAQQIACGATAKLMPRSG